MFSPVFAVLNNQRINRLSLHFNKSNFPYVPTDLPFLCFANFPPIQSTPIIIFPPSHTPPCLRLHIFFHPHPSALSPTYSSFPPTCLPTYSLPLNSNSFPHFHHRLTHQFARSEQENIHVNRDHKFCRFLQKSFTKQIRILLLLYGRVWRSHSPTNAVKCIWGT